MEIVGRIKCDCYINLDTKINKQTNKKRLREEDGRERRVVKFSSLKVWINKYGLIVKGAVNI